MVLTINQDESMFSFKFGMSLIAAAFIIWGAYTMICPSDMAIPHAVYKYGSPFMEIVPRDTSRIYGILGLLMGIGLLVLAHYPGRTK
jgi:hypothetical protein